MNQLRRYLQKRQDSIDCEDLAVEDANTENLNSTNDWENAFKHMHRGNFWSERTFLEKVLLVLLVVVIIVGIVLSIALASSKKGHGSATIPEAHAEVCGTPECVTSAGYLISAMDPSVDPCEDFFTFACGGYLNKTFLLGERVNRFSKISVNLLLRIKGLLEEPYQEDDPKHWNKTKTFYKKCMDLGERQRLRRNPLKDDLEKLGKWPLIETEDGWNSDSFSWSDTIKKIFELGYDKDILMKIDVDVDLRNSSKTILVVDQPTLTMPKILYLLEEPNDYGLRAYKLFIEKCTIMFNSNISLQELKEQVDDAVDIEIKLAKASLSASERKNFVLLYENHTMTFKELKEKYTGIPWKDLFDSFLPHDVTVTEDDEIWVPVPSAIEALQEILQNVDSNSTRKLANYMMYRVVLMAAGDLSHSFVQASYDFENTLTGKPFSYPDPWQECVSDTRNYFYYSLSSIYTKKYFQEETKKNVSSVEISIKDMLKEQIKDADWMDDETRNRALHKAERIEGIIGYPEEIMKDSVLDNFFEELKVNNNHYGNVREASRFFSILDMKGLHEAHDKHNWMEVGNILVANAFYSGTRNIIVIPVGVLQEETYNAQKPNYLNFGSLGMLLGHELTHGFDMTGGQFNENGDLEFWWTGETYRELQTRSECFIEQYNSYEVPEIGRNLNGTLTVNENMADTGGLYTAYKTYQRWVEKHGKEKRLPGLPYTSNQLFWLSFASVWCNKETAAHLEHAILHDEHSPPRYRVKGVLSNLKEFSTDFNCKKGSTMNPEKKCLLWT